MKNLMAKFSDYGWDMSPNKGGYDKMGYGYLVSWLGPVNESDDIYSASSFLSPVLNRRSRLRMGACVLRFKKYIFFAYWMGLPSSS